MLFLKNIFVRASEAPALFRYYLYFIANIATSFYIFYEYGRAYGAAALNNFTFYHVVSVYLGLILDFGISMYGQRYVASRCAAHLGFTRFVRLEVVRRLPISIAVGFLTVLVLFFSNASVPAIVYCVLSTLAAPLAVSWLYLGIGRLWPLITIALIKVALIWVFFFFTEFSESVAIYFLAFIQLVASAALFYRVKITYFFCNSVSFKTLIRLFFAPRKFFTKRIKYGASYVMDAASGFWPYFFIKVFLADAHLLAQFFLADRFTKVLQTLIQPVTVYFISRYAAKDSLRAEIKNIKNYMPHLVVVVFIGVVIEVFVYNFYLVKFFTEDSAASWRIFIVLLGNPILSIFGAVVGVLFVFQQRMDGIFLWGQIIGFLFVFLAPFLLNNLMDGVVGVAVAIVASKLAILIFYIIKGIFPFFRSKWRG